MLYQQCSDLVIDIAKSCLNLPYVWGGNNPITGFDCSGFTCWVYRSIGLIGAKDYNAQELADLFQSSNCMFPRPGGLVFFGSDLKKISHVAIALNINLMIEAGGGDHTTLTAKDAASKNACVRVHPITFRSDLRLCVLPKELNQSV